MTLRNDLKKYDQLRLKLMIKCLCDYKDGKIPFTDLGDSLESLVVCLESINDTWKNKALKHIGFLMITGDIMKFDKRIGKFSTPEEKTEVEESINKLIELIEPLIIKDIEE